MPKLALKIDVDTWRGTLQGVPRLVEILRRHRAGASFLFSLGPITPDAPSSACSAPAS
jgi:undecaprenyl phosphate-alpha-L-ara4FN deformylase